MPSLPLEAATPARPAPPPSKLPDAAGLREAFGQFATGVAVVTARTVHGRRLGMTINSLSSVSLEPAMLLWSLRRASRDHAEFTTQVERFAVHVLGERQTDLCERFMRRHPDRFEDLETVDSAYGVPLLDHCLARFECRLHQCVDAGDHSILIGGIEAVEQQPGEPLLFHCGRFARLGERN